MKLKHYTLDELCQVDLSLVDLSDVETEELEELKELCRDLIDHRWSCENCEHVNFADYSSGVEVTCEECGNVSEEYDESVYDVAEWLYKNLENI